jgi:hypothetical protein
MTNVCSLMGDSEKAKSRKVARRRATQSDRRSGARQSTIKVTKSFNKLRAQQQKDRALLPRERRALAAERRLGATPTTMTTTATATTTSLLSAPTQSPMMKAATARRVGMCDSSVDVCANALPIVPFQWRDYQYCSKECFERNFRKITSAESE